jgi:hypothetical protein
MNHAFRNITVDDEPSAIANLEALLTLSTLSATIRTFAKNFLY